MKRYSTSLVFSEMKIKTAMRNCYVPTRMTQIEKMAMPSVGKDEESLNSNMVDGNIKLCSHFGKQFENFVIS